MDGGPTGPKVGPGARRPEAGRPWFDGFTSLYAAGLLILLLGTLLSLLFKTIRSQYPIVNSAVTSVGYLFTGRPAQKVLPPDAGKAVEADAQRGRAARDTKYYQWLYQRLAASKQSGRDTTAAEKTLGEAGLAIQEGRFKLAEDLMSKVNFVLTEFGSDAQAPAAGQP